MLQSASGFRGVKLARGSHGIGSLIKISKARPLSHWVYACSRLNSSSAILSEASRVPVSGS